MPEDGLSSLFHTAPRKFLGSDSSPRRPTSPPVVHSTGIQSPNAPLTDQKLLDILILFILLFFLQLLLVGRQQVLDHLALAPARLLTPVGRRSLPRIRRASLLV